MFYQCTNTCTYGLVFDDMKVTVAVLDKNGDNAVEGVLDVLNSFDCGRRRILGLFRLKKAFLKKTLKS